MKKLFFAGLLALSFLATSQQQAAAWVKINFGVGLNFSYESGNNSWFWGAFNNGQVPGYPTNVPVGLHYGHGFGGYYGGYDMGGYYGGYDQGYYGGGYGGHHQQGGDKKQEQGNKQDDNQVRRSGNGYVSYQPVSYQPSYYYQQPSYYSQPNYYYPSYGYGYGYYSAPSYWYGY